MDGSANKTDDGTKEGSIKDFEVAATGIFNPSHSFSAMLDRIGLGWVVLDEKNNVIGWNGIAGAVLNIDREPKNVVGKISFALRQLLTEARYRLSPGTLSWIVIPYVDGTPVVVGEECHLLATNESVIFLVARDQTRKPNGRHLQKLFGLTGAETEVALSIAAGHTLLEIARSRKLSRTTVRSHLGSIFSKTDTKRQSEVVALLTSMAVMP